MKKIEGCEHCFHRHEGPIWMVVPPNHVVVECCLCGAVTTVHRDHAPIDWREEGEEERKRREEESKNPHHGWHAGRCRKHRAMWSTQ